MKEKKLISPLGWILIILFILLSFYAPYFAAKVWWPQYEFKETGQIGDTIGGIAGPIISALSAILLYLAFREQAMANRILQDQFRSDRAISIISRVEKYLPLFNEIVEKFKIPYVTPSLNRLLIAHFEKSLEDKKYDHILREGFEEKLNELKKKPDISINELESLSRDLRYVIGILVQATTEIRKCSIEDRIHFILLYDVYFKLEMHVFKELVKSFPSEDNDSKKFTDKIVSEIIVLDKKMSELNDSIQINL